jgi:hypothetical protein
VISSKNLLDFRRTRSLIFRTNLGLGEIKITFVGSLLSVGARWLIRKRAAPKTPEVKP